MWVEALRSGTHDGIRVRRRHVAEAAANVAAFLDDGVRIPGLWRHADYSAGGPRPPRELLIGYVTDFHHDAAGVLALNLALRSPDAADRLERAGHVSPRCAWNVVLGGVRYEGLSIGHVAATDSPRQRDQRAVQMSWCPFDDFDPYEE